MCQNCVLKQRYNDTIAGTIEFAASFVQKDIFHWLKSGKLFKTEVISFFDISNRAIFRQSDEALLRFLFLVLNSQFSRWKYLL